MSFDSVRPIMNGRSAGHSQPKITMEKLDESLKATKSPTEMQKNAEFHGDRLLADKETKLTGILSDLWKVLTPQNAPEVFKVAIKALSGQGLDIKSGARLVGSLSNDSAERAKLIQGGVRDKYEKMLHPPLTYLGDAFQYRAPDGKFNSVLHPHLGQAGAPYAKTVPSKTHALGALPDPGDLFDKLMAREPKGRLSPSGLSSMLIYHATIIIHDIFRTNDSDKNISDSSSYLDLSPLYGYTIELQRKVRDDKFKLGLLKPDTFAEDRLLRQPPGVCIMLVMYNRYHNYAATQLKRINENGRFSVPTKFAKTKLLAAADSRDCIPEEQRDAEFSEAVKEYQNAWNIWLTQGQKPLNDTDKAYEMAEKKMYSLLGNKGVVNGIRKVPEEKRDAEFSEAVKQYQKAWSIWLNQGQKPLDDTDKAYEAAEKNMYSLLDKKGVVNEISKFDEAHDAAWNKLDDDLFNTARLITCGMYVNISIHDYLRALMGFHQFDTTFTLDPRVDIPKHENVSRGLGNQVTVEFNLLYRFHCAISRNDESYLESFMVETMKEVAERAAAKQGEAGKLSSKSSGEIPDPKSLSMMQFAGLAAELSKESSQKDPWLQEFGLKDSETQTFKRNTITGLFDDEKMIHQLRKSMNDPISQFGPKNVPRALKNVEIMGILQARKWETGTLNDFRDFFSLGRHESFEAISKDVEIQDALRDLYDHPDKVELYPGIFCETNLGMNTDPGPSGLDSALWSAIFSDAITLVRSDRFYTVDWNTNSLTSWGMKEVSPDYDILKSSVFHRLLQRAFPEWFPYDSLRFFHPFYTAEQNATFAKQQNYASSFSGFSKGQLDLQASEPEKPLKPLLLTKYADIQAVLSTGADEIIHPAFTNSANLPEKVREALRPIKATSTAQDLSDSPESAEMTKAYFSAQMRAVVQREVIKMSQNDKNAVFQVDVTRDVAIPVVTRCIADFLGFGHQVKDVNNSQAKYSENEIYHHITNCQVFLAYNTDETKLLKRRNAFKTSMDFLLNLAREGNILEASRWEISRSLRNLFNQKPVSIRDQETGQMKALGMRAAKSILEQEKDSGKAAAILLLAALDVAYISVLAFTAVLDHLLYEAYNFAKSPGSESADWFEIQELALRDDEESDAKIQLKVLEAQRRSVKLPFIREVSKDGVIIPVNDKQVPLKRGQIIICDIYEAMMALTPDEISNTTKYCHLNYVSSLSAGIVHFNPKDVSLHGLTAMIKVVAQMKNLRRGHTSQGQVKRIQIDQTYEGYANFMAEERMQMIASDVKQAPSRLQHLLNSKKSDMSAKDLEAFEANEKLLKQQIEDASKVFNTEILNPKADTYLTAEWDEMVPFPTTWKVRFDGYGKSDYGGAGLPLLRPDPQPDSFPPFYQPQGPSHWGGTFADGVPKVTPADAEDVKTKGCGVPVPVLHSAPEQLDTVLH